MEKPFFRAQGHVWQARSFFYYPDKYLNIGYLKKGKEGFTFEIFDFEYFGLTNARDSSLGPAPWPLRQTGP